MFMLKANRPDSYVFMILAVVLDFIFIPTKGVFEKFSALRKNALAGKIGGV